YHPRQKGPAPRISCRKRCPSRGLSIRAQRDALGESCAHRRPLIASAAVGTAEAATTPAASASATATVSVTTTSAAIFAFAGDVHSQFAVLMARAIESFDGFLCFFFIF